MIYADLILNLALLIALTTLSAFIDSRLSKYKTVNGIVQGFVFGSSTVLAMMTPLRVAEGVIFDGRSLMLSLGALFFGGWTGGISAAMAIGYRVMLGGPGALTGALVSLMAITVGIVFRLQGKSRENPPNTLTLAVFGLIVHALMLLLMLTLPKTFIIDTIRVMAVPILILYPVATVLAGKILSDQVTLRARLEAIAAREREFSESLEFLPAPIGIARTDGKLTFLNHAFTATYGYELEDIPTMNEWVVKAYPDADYRNRMQKNWEQDVEAASQRGGPTHARLYEITCKDGSVKKAQISMRPIRNTFLTVFEDTTARLNLEHALRKKVMDLTATQEATIISMAILSEYRDTDTGSHIQRTKLYVKLLLESLGDACPYDQDTKELIWLSATLHDIGKVAIPDSILLKPGKLTDAEFNLMKQHPLFGRFAILRTQESLPENSFLNFAAEIAEYHHEKWDGSGYPHGLKGSSIPLSARVMAIADVYDACISQRPYKKPLSHEETVDIIRRGSASHFDPELVTLFLSKEAEFNKIATQYKE